MIARPRRARRPRTGIRRPSICCRSRRVRRPRRPRARSAASRRGDALSRYIVGARGSTRRSPARRSTPSPSAGVEQGDLEAARQLVLSNLRLVVKIAMEYRRSWTNLLDLIQEGNVGLLQAVQRFEPEQGVKLASYAAYWIRAYILKYLIDNIRMVRLGSSRAERKLFFRLNREKRELERQGYEVEPKLLAERLDVTEQDVISMEQRLAESDLSLDAPVQRRRARPHVRRRRGGPRRDGGGRGRRPGAARGVPREGAGVRRDPRRARAAASSSSASLPRSRARCRSSATSSA